jgi:4-amino-4-deoxy-L-arabinose transferase-like glycosyltransferase
VVSQWRTRIDHWAVLIVFLSLLLNFYQLQWGVHGNDSWAADELRPLTVLSVVKREFSQWNSGYFYFKYPPGWPFLLAASFSPYLVFLRLTGGWSHPTTQYPYGFADPQHALTVLALSGRTLSALIGGGTVAVAYALGREVAGRTAGRLSAVLAATMYPVIYYAHTTNVDGSFMFWLVLALYASTVARRSDRLLPWMVLGASAAMAVSTKEQGYGLLLPLPFIALGPRVWRQRSLRVLWSRPALAMAGATLVAFVLANNILYNPLGFAGRVAFLAGHPLQPIAVRLASVEFSWWKGLTKELYYFHQLWDWFESGLGAPLAWLALVAPFVVWRVPRAALILIPAFSHYYFSLRVLDETGFRYMLPLMLLGVIMAGILLAELWDAVPRAAHWAATLVIVTLLGICTVRAVELLWLIRTDPRYAAEAWLQEHATAGTRVEVYQKPVYLPRFADGVIVSSIPIAQRSVAGLQQRRPDFLVMSSASRKSVSHYWTLDWRTTRDLLQPIPDAAALLKAIEDGSSGYQPVAQFGQRSRTIRLRITSLCPTITVYAPNPA